MKKLAWLAGCIAVLWVGMNPDQVGFPFNIMVAALVAYVLFTSGKKILGGFATPIPEPPPPGELRKVKIMYRCEICGSEVRMTIAPEQDPEPPRHCMDEMTLVAPIE